MSCFVERYREEKASNEQKWDYINLSDFRSGGCGSPFSYGFLILLGVISVAVYAVDLFTCANLIFFDKWSGQVKPVIPFEISRWIFAGCIMLSWILLAYRLWRAVRAMKTDIVAASYLDPLAVRLQSLRIGSQGRGWRRFLVFAALTKGRKGAEYVALFTYFSFEAWLRICFAEGPRQVINALTLYSVLQADLVPVGQHAAAKNHSPIVQFFVNVQILANKNREQAAILFGMLFTLIIWIFSALSLILALVFYITFLWHHIRDGCLSKYCRRKIDTRLHKIVAKKVNKALEKEYKVRTKQQERDLKNGLFVEPPKRQPTLPILDTDLPRNPAPISRQTTRTNVSLLSRSPPSTTNYAPSILDQEPRVPSLMIRDPTVPNILAHGRPEPPSRGTTQDSYRSDMNYTDDAPLMDSAAPMGYGGYGGPDTRTLHSARPPPGRTATGSSQGTQRTFGSGRSGMGPSRTNTDLSGRSMPPSYTSQPPVRRPVPPNLLQGPSGFGRAQEYEMQNRPPASSGGYVPFNPNSSNDSWGAPVSGPAPSRNLTQPHRPLPYDYFGSIERPQRSCTAPIPQPVAYGNPLYSGYRPAPYRSATTGPGGQRRPTGLPS